MATLFQGIDIQLARVMTIGHDWGSGCSLLRRIDIERRPSFLVCLHITILVDQAMDYHFPSYYRDFERLTMYPKFRVGLGHPAFINPIRVLEAPIQQRDLVDEGEIRKLIPDGMQLFARETDDFLRRFLPQLSTAVFFDRVISDPDIAAGWEADRSVAPENLSLMRFVAREIGESVDDLLKKHRQK